MLTLEESCRNYSETKAIVIFNLLLLFGLGLFEVTEPCSVFGIRHHVLA